MFESVLGVYEGDHVTNYNMDLYLELIPRVAALRKFSVF